MTQMKMNNPFKSIHTYDVDLYIVDYTEQTREDKTRRRGVELHTQKPEDIKGVHVYNPDKISFKVVNFEEGDNIDFFKDEDGEVISQCECIGIADELNPKKKAWAFALELKYPHSKKGISRNKSKAKHQVLSTLEYLFDTGVLSKSYVNYLIVSIPRFPTRVFGGFRINQHDKLALRRMNAFIKATNAIRIENQERLSFPKE